MYDNGVARTTLDDVGTAAGVGRSQLYHYFAGKSDLVGAVIDFQIDAVISAQDPELVSWDAWLHWRDRTVLAHGAAHGMSGCPIGSLASELADIDEPARERLVAGFAGWEAVFRSGLERMVENGALRSTADPATLATSVLASLQGGLLLCRLERSTAPLEAALDAALAHLRCFGAADTAAA